MAVLLRPIDVAFGHGRIRVSVLVADVLNVQPKLRLEAIAERLPQSVKPDALADADGPPSFLDDLFHPALGDAWFVGLGRYALLEDARPGLPRWEDVVIALESVADAVRFEFL